MRASVAAALLAFVISSAAHPLFDGELFPRTGGTCTGPHSALTGEECAKAAQAIGFKVGGECLSIKMAGGSVHKHQSGECYKQVAGGGASTSGTHSRPRSYDELVMDLVTRAEELKNELVARSDTGTCTGSAHSTLTGEECTKVAGGAVGWKYDGTCYGMKTAGSSLYKHKSGTCYKQIAGGGASTSGTRSRPRSYEEVLPRTTGTCTGPHSVLTGEQCANAAQAIGFKVGGECLSIKMAGGSVHKHQSGECYKQVAGGGASTSGTHSRPRSYDEMVDQVIARALVSRSENAGTCTGSAHSTLTGEECTKVAGGAVGFKVDGECFNMKMAGSSLYKHKSGTCYKQIAGGASGSGTRSRPRSYYAQYEY